MTAAAVNRAPTPRPSQSSTTLAASTPGVLPPPSLPAAAAAPSRRQPRAPPADPLSDRVTTALVRRTLCPQQLKADKGRDSQTPIEDLLPPLTSRNDVDLQLYAFLAIILRDFVQSWYGRITTDETFVAEVVHVIAHCTRALEQRFRKLDLESLVLDEIPELLDRHVTAYRIARQPGTRPPLTIEPNEVYHSLHPLPYLHPVPRPDDPVSISAQQANEKDYRQLLVQGVLALLLPTEDLENPCLTSLVGQIFSELIIGNVVANKAAQPWLLLEAICILCNVIGRKRKAESIVPEVEANHNHGKPVHEFFVSAIQLVIHIFTTIRFLVLTIAMSSSLPPRSSSIDGKVGAENHYERELHQPSHHPGSAAVKTPVLAFRIWACIGNLIELDLRMPWLSGLFSLIQHGAIHGPGRLASLDSSLDRLLSFHIQSLFSPSRLPSILRTLRGVLFPNNAPGVPGLFPPTSEAELRALRRRAARALRDLMPTRAGRLYFGGRLWHIDDDASKEESMLEEVEGLLMVLSDEYCNKHLMYSILELILVRLMPELSEKGVVELWDERLG